MMRNTLWPMLIMVLISFWGFAAHAQPPGSQGLPVNDSTCHGTQQQLKLDCDPHHNNLRGDIH